VALLQAISNRGRESRELTSPLSQASRHLWVLGGGGGNNSRVQWETGSPTHSSEMGAGILKNKHEVDYTQLQSPSGGHLWGCTYTHM
jgi:hypothetical protein